jgi:hypothetical protein
MPLLYCTLHERAFAREHHSWMHFPRKDITPLPYFSHWLRSAKIESPEYAVVDAPCDQCAQPSHEQEKAREDA